MAVTFISNGYDTTTANPYTEAAWAWAHPSIGLATYGVRSATHWKVTAVAGQDRTVSINAGEGFGTGVTDKTFENETIQLDTISSGSRWDLIAVRRDWTPTGGESKFVKVNGGATPVIPGGRQATIGNIDDQPLALVQVTAGQTQPTAIIGLRTWAGDGGGLIAEHDLVRSFLNSTGTRLWIDGVDWIRRAGANDTPEWVSAGTSTTYSPLTVPGYSIQGAITATPVGTKQQITVDINVSRTGAPGVIPSSPFANFGAVLPVAVRGAALGKYLPVALSGGGANVHATVFLDPSNGVLQIRGVQDFNFPTGAVFTVNASYYI